MANTVKLGDESFQVESGQTILDAALMEGIDFPHSCQVGSCISCRCKLVTGEIRPLIDFDYVLMPDEIEQGMILACQSTPLTDVQISLDDD